MKLNYLQFFSIQQKKKTVINHQFGLEKPFQEISFGIERSIDERADWIIESIDSQYININLYQGVLTSNFLLN